MIKKGLNIILLGWLINALVFFHPIFGDHGCMKISHGERYDTHADNTLIDVIFNHFIANKGHKKDAPRKAFIKARYISVRAANLVAVLPHTLLFDFQDRVQRICFSRFKFWETKEFLPPHHNFLFRLSPF